MMNSQFTVFFCYRTMCNAIINARNSHDPHKPNGTMRKTNKKNEQENRIDIEYHLDLIQLEMLNHSLTNGLQFKLTLNIYVLQYVLGFIEYVSFSEQFDNFHHR